MELVALTRAPFTVRSGEGSRASWAGVTGEWAGGGKGGASVQCWAVSGGPKLNWVADGGDGAECVRARREAWTENRRMRGLSAAGAFQDGIGGPGEKDWD